VTPLRKIALSTIFLLGLPLASALAAPPSERMNPPIIDDPSKPIMLTPFDTKWVPALSMLPAGAEMSILEGNPEKPGPFTLRLKLPANYSVPAHWHPYDERITVISGRLNMGLGDRLEITKGKVYSAGSYVRIPAKVHLYVWTTIEETVVQLHGIGPWALLYVDQSPAPLSDETHKGERIQESGIREG
jgi:hypothetical protein